MSVGQTQEHEHEVQQENKAEKDDKELQKLAQTEAIKIMCNQKKQSVICKRCDWELALIITHSLLSSRDATFLELRYLGEN